MPKTVKATLPASVEGYLKALPAEVSGCLQRLRKIIKAAAPEAEEKISYQIPGYTYMGPLVFFAAFKNHCSLFAVSRGILKTLEMELQPFKVVNTTIRFKPENPLPSSLVRKIVALRMQENKQRKALKKTKAGPS